MVRTYRRRSCISIMSQILDAAVANRNNNVTKTKIRYKAYVSHTQLKEYLQVLTENGLLSYNAERHTFKTTGKGHRFLEIYNNIYELFEGAGEEQLEKEKERELLVAI